MMNLYCEANGKLSVRRSTDRVQILLGPTIFRWPHSIGLSCLHVALRMIQMKQINGVVVKRTNKQTITVVKNQQSANSP